MHATKMAFLAPCLMLSLLTSGCSFLFVKGPPSYHESLGYVPSCTESKAVPTLDVILAGLSAVGTAQAFGDDNSEYDSWGASRDATIISGIAWTGVYVASAITGSRRVQDCRAAQAAAVARLGAPAVPPPVTLQAVDAGLEWRPPELLPVAQPIRRAEAGAGLGAYPSR